MTRSATSQAWATQLDRAVTAIRHFDPSLHQARYFPDPTTTCCLSDALVPDYPAWPFESCW